MEKNKEAEIGTLAVKMCDVDHSIMGASAYFIQGKKSIVYTGDFRYIHYYYLCIKLLLLLLLY